MKMKEFVDNCVQLLKDNPEIADFDVISSINDEGNAFNEVTFTPTIGLFNDGDFDDVVESTSNLNAVCIN